MKGKILRGFATAVVLSGVSLSAVAAVNQVVYIGGAPVYSETDFNWNMDSSTSGGNVGPLMSNYNSNIQGQLFGGYAFIFGYNNNFSLGLEAGATFGNRTGEETATINEPNTTNIKATMNSMFNLDLRPGYIFDSGNRNSMAYLIAGATTADFSFKGNGDNDAPSFSDDAGRHYGARIGAGYALGLSSHVMARLEYVFSDYGSFNFNDNDGNTYQVSPISHEVDLGLAFVLPF